MIEFLSAEKKLRLENKLKLIYETVLSFREYTIAFNKESECPTVALMGEIVEMQEYGQLKALSNHRAYSNGILVILVYERWYQLIANKDTYCIDRGRDEY